MQRVLLNGAEIEYDVLGAGEPLLLIHGSIIAEAFFPLLQEAALTRQYRIITYHRRGFASSSHAPRPFTIREQAADSRALLAHLGISRAHVAGHSYGAATAIQLALDAPAVIQTLALLEAPLLDATPSGPSFWEGVAAIQGIYEHGDKTAATGAFMSAVGGPEFQAMLDAALPPGTFARAVADIDTFFQVEVPALRQWRFTAEDARRLTQPVLLVVGQETAPVFREGHDLLKQWVPQAEELPVPQATHALQMMNANAVAEGLASFFAKNAR